MRLPTLRQAPATHPDSIDARQSPLIQHFADIAPSPISATIFPFTIEET